jgi:hypothetical protein
VIFDYQNPHGVTAPSRISRSAAQPACSDSRGEAFISQSIRPCAPNAPTLNHRFVDSIYSFGESFFSLNHKAHVIFKKLIVEHKVCLTRPEIHPQVFIDPP